MALLLDWTDTSLGYSILVGEKYVVHAELGFMTHDAEQGCEGCRGFAAAYKDLTGRLPVTVVFHDKEGEGA